MKLVLKRHGVKSTPISDGPACRDIDTRPFALHDESGEILPCQVSTSLNSSHGNLVTVTVVFEVDGRALAVEGDQ